MADSNHWPVTDFLSALIPIVSRAGYEQTKPKGTFSSFFSAKRPSSHAQLIERVGPTSTKNYHY